MKTQSKTYREYARSIYNDPKTLTQLYLKTGPHADTHTNERNPEFFIGPSQLRRETSWGSEFGWVPGRRRKGVLHAAAPDNGRWFGPQSHVWDSRFVAELGW